MIPRIHWNDPNRLEPLSPFTPGKRERRLRVTFHTTSFAAVSKAEHEILILLYELAAWPEIDALATGLSDFPRTEVHSLDTQSDTIPVSVQGDRLLRQSSIPFAAQWLASARQQASRWYPDSNEDTTAAVATDMLVARAHQHFGSDIFISASEALVQHRDDRRLRDANILTPAEAAKLVGLFLRARDAHVVRKDPTQPTGWLRLPGNLFFQWLVVARLPNLMNYVTHCSESQNPEVVELARTIHRRCIRSFQVLDVIGQQFYASSGKDPTTQDSFQRTLDDDPEMKVMPYFEYLTFILSGILDAQALIASHVYGLIEKYPKASFTQKGYRKALRSDASELYELGSNDTWFRALGTMLREPRNTIHRIGMKAFVAGPMSLPGSFSRPQHLFVSLSESLKGCLLEASRELGSPERWGLVKVRSEIWLEPYSYARTLVEECVKAFESVAQKTDVAGRVTRTARAQAEKYAPEEESLRDRIRRAVVILG